MSSPEVWPGGLSGSLWATIAVFWLGMPMPGAVAGDQAGAGTFSGGGNSWVNSSRGGNSWISSSGNTTVGPGGGMVIGGSGAVGSGPSNHIDYNPSFIVGYGPYGPIIYTYPVVVVGPGGVPPIPQPIPQPVPAAIGRGGGGMMLPMPARQPATTRTSATRRPNPARARELVEIGDRSFRGDNTKRAEERYRLAAKADPGSASPLVRLAQVALVRGRYADAARFLREAVAAEPGFLLNAPDIQAVYSEPADFAQELSDLERHLQAEPGDRDAWFVLGAEWYLSGRTQKAADAFQRLTDRRPDLALAAFLDATNPRRAAPPEK